MDKILISNKNQNIKLQGEITIPADKSISHRSLIFGALTNSKIKIKNISKGQDCISTMKIFEKLGVKFEVISENELLLDNSSGFQFSNEMLEFDCGNSGTTTRLLAGLFCGIEGLKCRMIGDNSLSKRPMKRILEPLKLMGADIKSNDNKLPLEINGKKLNSITYNSPIASAQVKSCLLLAGLNANSKTRVYEKTLSRNHSEIMFEYLGANIISSKDKNGYFAEISKSNFIPKDIEIVGDISSAAFFMVAAAIVPNSEILLKNVGINVTRSGIVDIFKQAKIDFELLNQRKISHEDVCDIKIRYTKNIQPFEIKGDIIPRLIDEIPILAILATQANGRTIVKDAKDLRNKESDRIKTICDTLRKFDISVVENEDGFEIIGKAEINKEIELDTYLDHRLAMSYYVLSLINSKTIKINGFDCIQTSFPEFLNLFSKLIK